MFLTPSDREKLLLSVAGMVARDRLERGVRLNHPEAIALLSCWALERAREGATVEQLMAEGVHVLTADQVMPGVPELVDHLQVEATFPDGRKLVTLSGPIRPAADAEAVAEPGEEPGAIRVGEGEVQINTDREVRTVVVVNDGDRPVQIGSHIHLADVNPAISFSLPEGDAADRSLVHGFRLDIPAGTSLRFQPGDSRAVQAVALGGRREVPGIRVPAGAGLEEKQEEAR
ncbi:urease subunit gamma [Nocardiopsis sp. CNT-189]|uniref:urease subunit gamma n=1 Tax=Nocardiopsis oceanisediminis TaxID=2816862 RepID=UPI003B32A15B